MNEEQAEVEQRRKALRVKLAHEAHTHERAARLNESLVSSAFYASMLFGASAAIAGLVHSRFAIPPEAISLLAALGTGVTFFAREAKYRMKADWHYAVRDTAQALVARLDYEMPAPTTLGDIAAVSQEWVRKREALGARMAAINGSSSSVHNPPPRP